MKRDDFYAAMERAVVEAEEKIASCHRARACPTCRAPMGKRCVRKGQHPRHGAELKHPHEARWTPDVPKR